MRTRRLLIASGLLILLLAGAWLAQRSLAHHRLEIHVDNQTIHLDTRAATVGAALAEAGVWYDGADVVAPPPQTSLAGLGAITVQRAALVSLVADGGLRLLRLPPRAPAAILAGSGLDLEDGDAVWVDGRLVPAGPELAGQSAPAHQISVQRALTVTIQEAGAAPRIERTSARTVGEALAQLGYTLYAADAVSPPLDTLLRPGLAVTLQRALPVVVQVDGQAVPFRTRQTTVAASLAEAGIALLGADYTVPAEDQPLPASGVVAVVRVREEILTEQQIVPYETTYQPLDSVEIDNVYPVQAGQPGVLRRLTRVRYENGVEVARVPEAEVLVQAPVPLVIGYGTQIVVRTLDTPDGPVDYWRAYTMYATSYAAKFTNRTPGTPSYGRTASGKIVTKGLVAIDRRLIPFGTRMYVPGYGFAEAADTGGGVRGRFIDLGFDDWNYEGWHRVVTVYFLTPVPPADQIRWIIPSTVP
jgi:uncharacterized protein YabE (DUF348 family)